MSADPFWLQTPEQRPSSLRRGHDLVVRVPWREEWTGWVTSTRCAGVWCHYRDGRTLPCLTDVSPCPSCAGGHVPRFYAYLSLWVPAPPGRHVVLELPEKAYHALKEISGLRWPDGLMGMGLCVGREAAEPRAPVRVRGVADPQPAGRPRGLDVPAVLTRLWGWKPPRPRVQPPG